MEIISENGEHFDINTDYSFDFEFINPLLSEVGSQTSPAILPYTRHNLRLLDYPNRSDRTRKYAMKRDVTLREGTFQKKATQSVLKANEKDKIVTTFYVDEAVFYEKIKSLKLTQIDYQVDSRFPTKNSPSVDRCMDVITEVLALKRASNFHVFPIYTKCERHIKFLEFTKDSEIINCYEMDQNPIAIKDWTSRQDVVDNVAIKYPKGYGITIFLKIGFVLDSIATCLGYKITNNFFNTHAELQHLVLINNVADTIVKGYVDYNQLVPDIFVSDFILMLRNKFGVFITVNEVLKEIRVNTFEEVLNMPPDYNLTNSVTEEPKIEWSEPKQIKLTAGTSLPLANTETDLYEDFIKAHGEPGMLDFPPIPNKLILDVATNTYVTFVTNESDTSKYIEVRLSSSNFNYYTHDKLEQVEFNSEDERVAMESLIEITGNDNRPYCGYVLPIVDNRANLNSTLYIDNKKQDNKKDNSKSIILAFRVPKLYTEYNIPMGTPYSAGYDTTEWGDLSLTYHGEKGLYNTFWKTYDTCLRHSFQVITVPLNLSLPQLQMIQLHTPKLLFNQPVLIERIKCRISTGKFQITEATFRSLREYKD